MRDNVKDFGGVIITATAFYEQHRSSEQEGMIRNSLTVPDGGIYKVGFLVDAQTSMGKWDKLLYPTPTNDKTRSEYLSSKLIMLHGYAQDVAMMAYIRHMVRWHSGREISLPHLISHMADLVEERIQVIQGEPPKSLPTLRSFNAEPTVPDARKSVSSYSQTSRMA